MITEYTAGTISTPSEHVRGDHGNSAVSAPPAELPIYFRPGVRERKVGTGSRARVDTPRPQRTRRPRTEWRWLNCHRERRQTSWRAAGWPRRSTSGLTAAATVLRPLDADEVRRGIALRCSPNASFPISRCHCRRKWCRSYANMNAQRGARQRLPAATDYPLSRGSRPELNRRDFARNARSTCGFDLTRRHRPVIGATC